jgi:hypothetical protein
MVAFVGRHLDAVIRLLAKRPEPQVRRLGHIGTVGGRSACWLRTLLSPHGLAANHATQHETTGDREHQGQKA